MTFRPDLIRYKGRRNVGRHAQSLLSYRGALIMFTAEGGLLTVAITPRPAQMFPAQDILEYLGFDTALQVEESEIERYGGGDSYIYRQTIPTNRPAQQRLEG